MSFSLLFRRLQSHIPKYKKTWLEETSVFKRWLYKAHEEFELSWENELPTARNQNGLYLTGMKNTKRDQLLMIKIGKDSIFRNFDPEHFRILADIVTRYYFPHLLPNLCPMHLTSPNKNEAYMEGFHGQHRDTTADVTNTKLKEQISEIFKPKNNEIVIDCGAFIGFGAISYASKVQDTKIIAVEANDQCLELLSKNIKANKSKIIVPLKAAIWSESNLEVDLTTGGAQANSLIPGVISKTGKITGREIIKTKTIDDVVNEFNLTKVDMLSLTVNGVEPEALLGAKNTLSEKRPRIRLAGWYQRDEKTIARICKPLLEKHDYFVHIGKRNGVMAFPKELIK